MFVVVVVLKLCYMVSDDKDALRFHEHGEVTFDLAFQQMLISDRIYIFFYVFIRLKSSERLLNGSRIPPSESYGAVSVVSRSLNVFRREA